MLAGRKKATANQVQDDYQWPMNNKSCKKKRK